MIEPEEVMGPNADVIQAQKEANETLEKLELNEFAEQPDHFNFTK